MIVFEFKAKGTKQQYQKIDEAIINRLGRKHLKVSRQRKDNAIKQALCVAKSKIALWQ